MKHSANDEDCTKKLVDISEPTVVYGNHTFISFDGFEGGNNQFLNNTTGKKVAGVEENRINDDEVAMKGSELVTDVQGHCVEDAVPKK